MSLFVAGAVLGEVQVLFVVVGAVFGEVQVSLFVAGAVLGEGLNVRLGAKRCILQKKMLLGTSKSNLICEAGCGLRFHSRIMLGSFSDHSRIMLGSCSDHSRIVPALEMTFHLFSKILSEISQCNFA